MVEPSVIALADAVETSADAIGPKALSLLRMTRARLPVPPAFCITSAAYRRQLQDNKLTAQIEQSLTCLESADVDRTIEILASIRDSITAGALSEDLRCRISDHLDRLGAAHLAVRSSSTAEDLPGHSFAGLHDTILGVSGLADCLDAVKRCWASLWSRRAYEYRRKNGFDHLDTSMAVIVQTLINAESAGVAFTANPVTGRSSNIIIESCPGLGEALVSGRVTPDRFTFDKQSLQLIGSLPGNKPFASRLNGSGGTHLEKLDEDLAVTPAVNRKTARRIARLARRCERLFGGPQDIEWALKGRRLYLLQSRPITAKPKELNWQDRQLWTNLNLREVVPDVMTPATEHIIRTMMYDIFGSIFRILCVDLGEHPLVDLIAGRLYWNINTGLAMFGHLPGFKGADLDTLFGGQHVELYRAGYLDLAAEDVPELHGSFARMLLRMPRTLWDLYTHRPSKAKAILQRFVDANEHIKSLDIPNLTPGQCRQAFDTIIHGPLAEVDLMHLMTSLYALPLTYALTERWLGDEHGRIAGSLFAGLGGMADAEAGLAIWQLARIAHAHPEIERAIDANDTWEKTRAAITTLPDGQAFVDAWDAFLLEHGHHCRGELELFNARWCETPDYCLDMVRSYLRCLGDKDPRERLREIVEKRRQTIDECRQRLRNPLKRWLLTYFVRTAAHGCTFRENIKDQVVRMIARCRMALLELGRRLTEQGVFTEPDDIFFLPVDQVDPLFDGRIPPDLQHTIADRRREYDRNCAIMPPDIVIGRFDPDNFIAEPLDSTRTVLRGISASSGVATGKARVIVRADADSHLEPGEILVAPFTDPGWVPYFLPAAAIVMDQGGILSHGSIVAREYGIPAVVNVGPATKIIKTGQTITVNADTATVHIHD